MIVNTYEMYRVALERMTDDLRDAEHRRLVRSIQGDRSGWLQRLGLILHRPVTTPTSDPQPSQTVSRPTL
jgi:hypothetical protein